MNMWGGGGMCMHTCAGDYECRVFVFQCVSVSLFLVFMTKYV